MHQIFTDISFIHVFKCFHFYVLPFFRKDNLFCLKNNDCLYKLYFYFFLFFLLCFKLFLFIFIFLIYIYIFLLFFLIFPYFRGISLNSRADLEFKEIRLFSTMIFQKKRLKFYGFFQKILMVFSFSTMIFRKKAMNFISF